MDLTGTFIGDWVFSLYFLAYDSWWFGIFEYFAVVFIEIYLFLESIAPIALSLVGIGLIVIIGMNLFKRISNKF